MFLLIFPPYSNPERFPVPVTVREDSQGLQLSPMGPLHLSVLRDGATKITVYGK